MLKNIDSKSETQVKIDFVGKVKEVLNLDIKKNNLFKDHIPFTS